MDNNSVQPAPQTADQANARVNGVLNRMAAKISALSIDDAVKSQQLEELVAQCQAFDAELLERRGRMEQLGAAIIAQTIRLEVALDAPDGTVKIDIVDRLENAVSAALQHFEASAVQTQSIAYPIDSPSAALEQMRLREAALRSVDND